MQNKYKVLTLNTIIFALANLAARAINFLLIPLYTNVLTTAEYGQAEIILNCVNLIMPFLSLSISDSFLRFGLDKALNVTDVLKTTTRVLIGSTIAIILLNPIFALYSDIGNFSRLFIIICISQLFRNTYCLYAKIVNKNNIFAYDTVIYTLTLGLSNIFLLTILKLGVEGYLLAYIFSNFCSIFFLFIKLSILKDLKLGKFNKILLLKMLSYSIPMIANSISWWMLQFSDRIMLRYYLSNSEVGIYSVATKIPNILTMIVGVFLQAWMISSIIEYNKENSSSFYSTIFKLYFLILSLSTCALLCVIKPLIKIIIGKEFIDSIRYIPLLIESAFFGSISSFVAPFYSAVKKNIIVTLTTFVAATCNIVLNIFLIPRFGIMGAVISTLFSYFVIGIVRLYNSRRYVYFYIPHFKFWGITILTLLLAIFTTYSDLFKIEIYILISIILILIILYIFYKEIKKYSKKLLEMFYTLKNK